jgi:hypothetical protein
MEGVFMKQYINLLIIALLITGCTATYHQQALSDNARKLDKGKGVFISVPEDGQYGNQTYFNSGKMTANAVKAALLKYTNTVKVSNECHADKCFSAIPIETYGYYVKPEILHWEDRATAWSGKPDRIEVMLTVFDAATGAEISSASLKGKSKYVSLGSEQPQDLLLEPINKYVESLY